MILMEKRAFGNALKPSSTQAAANPGGPTKS